jgi:nitroreductase
METLKAIELRKSTRDFKPDPVPERDIDVLLKAANEAPVGMAAFDTVCLTVIQDRELMGRISKAATDGTEREGSDIYYGAPTLIVISALKSSPPMLQFANAACIVENLLLAATDLGLGNVYVFGTVEGFRKDESLLTAAEIPEGFAPASSVAIGYPTAQAEATPKAPRNIKINRV